MGVLKSVFGGAPKAPRGPSPEEIRRREEQARQRERERLEKEQAQKKAEQKREAEATLRQKESRRKAFAGQLSSVGDDEEKRKKFLKGA